MLPRLGFIAAASALCAAAYFARAAAAAHYDATQRYEDVYYVPPPAWLPVFSLGHDEALADLLWMRALVYFGDEIRHRGEVAHVFDYADAILTLDPDFKRVYRWVGVGALYRTGTVTVDDMKRAVDYLERATRRFPDDGEVAWDLGGTLLYELVPQLPVGDEREAYRRRGVAALQVAARRGGGPPWLVLSNAATLRRLGQTEQAIRHLEEMYASVRDPDVRDQIGAQLEALRSRAYAEAFERANQELEAERLRDYPYVDPTMHVLLRPRRDLSAIAPLGVLLAPPDDLDEEAEAAEGDPQEAPGSAPPQPPL